MSVKILQFLRILFISLLIYQKSKKIYKNGLINQVPKVNGHKTQLQLPKLGLIWD